MIRPMTSAAPDTPRAAWTRQIMGLPVSIHLRGPGSPAAREQAVAAAFAELTRADELFSTYRADSEISRLNRGELASDDCDPLVHEVLDLCEQAREITGGSFDAWRIAEPGVVDPSGLVKGWAAERAAALLTGHGDDHYLNAGGDIALGRATGLAPFWRIGVEDPSDPSRLLGTLALGSGAIATSGITRRGTHIVDPATGGRPTALLSATVTGPSLMWADVLATAIVARSSTELHWITVLGYEALTVTPDGGLTHTDGFVLQ
jgi:thiamine biosynthesis lipoprotein